MSGLPTPDIPMPGMEKGFTIETVPGFAANLSIPCKKVEGVQLSVLAKGSSLEVALTKNTSEEEIDFLGEAVKIGVEDTQVEAAKPGKLQDDVEYMKKLGNKLATEFNKLDLDGLTKNYDGQETTNPSGLVARKLFPDAYKDYEGYVVGDSNELPADVLERYNAKMDAAFGSFLSKK